MCGGGGVRGVCSGYLQIEGSCCSCFDELAWLDPGLRVAVVTQ